MAKRKRPLAVRFAWFAMLVAVMGISACASPEPVADDQSPPPAEQEPAAEIMSERYAEGQDYMVAAAHPLAVDAGTEMLEQGGNAIDAAVAALFVLEVVEPMMAGIGGGGAITIWNAEHGIADYIDAYATAGADPDDELEDMDGDEISPERHAAVPGTVGGLYRAHERHGDLAWETLIQPAIEVARDGFVVHTMLARVVPQNEEKLTRYEGSADLFFPDGEAIQAGDVLKRPELADTFERIAQHGAAGFYEGPVAEEMAEVLQEGGSPITADDFQDYEPNWRRPLCGTFHGHSVLTAPPPLSGTEVLHALALLEDYGIPERPRPTHDADSFAALVGAIRSARADRGEFIGDPDDAFVPAAAMGSAEYAAERRSILMEEAPDQLEAGNPGDVDYSLPDECQRLDAFDIAQHPPETGHETGAEAGPAVEVDIDKESQHTTHLSVVDGEGNAASLTFTMGRFFGEGVYAAGAYLNTAAVNFGGPESNRRGAHRTPRSSTAPTLVLDGNDEVRLAVGSPGSGRIPPAITQMVMYTLGYDMHPVDAIYQPRVYPYVNSTNVHVEGGYPADALRRARELGYSLQARSPINRYFGGVHMIRVTDDGTRIGVADPRRDGTAAGR